MEEFKSINKLARSIKIKFDSGTVKKKITLLYAFNSTGKTRLSLEFSALAENEVLCYNAFVEDLFKWDNEKYVLKIDTNSWIVDIIDEQGLINNISDNYTRLVNSRNEPNFDLNQGEISFRIATGDDTSLDNIKISKGEESIFIWSIFLLF